MPSKSDFPPVPVQSEPFSDTLLHSLWQHFSDDPHRAAMINAKDDSDRVTFGELYVYSYAVAAFLHSKSFARGDVACLVLPNCWEFVAIFAGTILQGGAMTGANHLSTQYELQRQISDSKCKIVFCSGQSFQIVKEAVEKCPSVSTIVIVGSLSASLTNTSVRNLEVLRFEEVLRTDPIVEKRSQECVVDKDVLILPYSSGTTGSSKGVMISHKNFGTMMAVQTSHFNANIVPYLDANYDYCQENLLFILPFYHIYGFGMVMNCLLNGSTAVFLDSFDHEYFCRSVQMYKFKMLMVVPPVLIWLAKSRMVDEYDFTSIRLLFSGAAPAGLDLCLKLKKRFPYLKHIAQGYGMTEVSMACHLPVLDKERLDSSGKLISNLEMKIIDVVTGEKVEKGMPGELHVRGPTIMMGYLNRPDATAEAIDRDGWLKTGDIGYLDKEGFIFIIDRLKELIKVKGFQVPPAELEDLLLSHPLIKDCAVIGVPDRMSGEIPKAFVVRANQDLTEPQVQDFVKERLAYYKHLRGGVEFVKEIPKSPSGKILRRLLRERNKGVESKI